MSETYRTSIATSIASATTLTATTNSSCAKASRRTPTTPRRRSARSSRSPMHRTPSCRSFDRDIRKAQIRDEQTPSPTPCTALDGGVRTQAAAVQAYEVAATACASTTARRSRPGHAVLSRPGAGRRIDGATTSQLTTATRRTWPRALCGARQRESRRRPAIRQPVRRWHLPSQAAVNAAKDYAINLIEPVAPAALRGDQLASVAGQDAAVRRRSFNARMSLAQSFVDQLIGMQTPSVPLTPQQQQYLQNMGLPARRTGLGSRRCRSKRSAASATSHWAATSASDAAGRRSSGRSRSNSR